MANDRPLTLDELYLDYRALESLDRRDQLRRVELKAGERAYTRTVKRHMTQNHNTNRKQG